MYGPPKGNTDHPATTMDGAFGEAAFMNLDSTDTANTMPVDALAILGARASASIVLTPKARIFHLQHQKN